MDPDFQRFTLFVLQAIGSGFCGILWMNFRDLKAMNDATSLALSAHKLHVAENYVTQTDLSKAIDAFSRSLDALLKKLDRIEEKLYKQDKV